MPHRKTENPHAIFIPFPLQGHLIPSVLLAIKLASKGFTITFINTESIHHSITKSSSPSAINGGHHDGNIFAEARSSGLDIRYATVSDGLPLGFDRSLNHDQYMECLLHVFSAHVDEFVGNLVKSDASINCLIADSFHVWPLMISNKYKLVNISFWTEPALVLTLYYHMDLLKKNGHYDPLYKHEEVGSIKPKDMMSYLQATNTNTAPHRIIHKALFEDARKADFMICNTIHELESQTISVLNQIQSFYAIGPIFHNKFTEKLVSTNLWYEVDCTRWLDDRPLKSVLYISFGSYAHTSKHDLEEIAYGLLQSGVRFVWALRNDIVSSNDTNALPLGFEDQVKDQGLIVPWCDQKTILSHPSIGGFMTHCGWNSVLESIWCGVPLICFPLLTDQFTNRKLVVDDWKVGINLCEGYLVRKEEVTKRVKDLMIGAKSSELRKEMKKIKTTLQDALALGGSSQQNFDKFVSEVKKHEDVIDYIPGIESINPKDMMSYLQATNTNTVTHRIIHKALFGDARRADFMLCNTIHELESPTISTLNQMQPFYAIGPIFHNKFSEKLVSTNLWYEVDCTRWLDDRPLRSVSYISFGSYAHTSKHDLEEIAYGLLQSGVSFVWTLRNDIVSSNDTNALPLGFEDQVKEQGVGFTWKTQIGKNHGQRKPRTNSLYFRNVTEIGERLQKRELHGGNVLGLVLTKPENYTPI
ncbi:hypothetical protein LXL04_012706 [Taraxacum kok-saghyz]